MTTYKPKRHHAHALYYLEPRFIVACQCGWTSHGHHSRQDAREAYREHKAEHTRRRSKPC